MYTITMSRKGIPNKISKKVLFKCLTCGDSWLDYPSRVGRKKFCSQSCSAKSRIEELRQRSMGNSWGSRRKITDELRLKLSSIHRGKRNPKGSLAKMGENNPNWRGGTSPENKRIRMSAQFKIWRTAVFERDDYTCQHCGVRGGELHPDHIKQFAYYPELRFDINNGRTLCADCHRKTPSWGFKKHKLPQEQK